MYVFVDDSGDCGLKLAGGSSQFIVLSACVFPNGQAVDHAWHAVNASRFMSAGPLACQIQKSEYKYAKTKLDRKDVFFDAIKDENFVIRNIFMDKKELRSDYLRSNPNYLKAFLLKQMLTHTNKTIRSAKLIVDGDDNRSFGTTDRDYFMHGINHECPGTISSVEFVDSKKNEVIQIADMIAGSTRRMLSDDPNAQRHFDTYKHRLFRVKGGSHWRFK